MHISHRLPLTDIQVTATRIAELRGTFYWWFPQTRKFVLKHFGVPIEIEDVHPRAIAMLIMSTREIEMPNVLPLVPPKQPYRRAAWDFGFTASKCKATVERARREIPTAAAVSGGVPPLVIDRDVFIFIYAHQLRSNGRVPVPHTWATERGATAVQIREVLKDFAR